MNKELSKINTYRVAVHNSTVTKEMDTILIDELNKLIDTYVPVLTDVKEHFDTLMWYNDISNKYTKGIISTIIDKPYTKTELRRIINNIGYSTIEDRSIVIGKLIMMLQSGISECRASIRVINNGKHGSLQLMNNYNAVYKDLCFIKRAIRDIPMKPISKYTVYIQNYSKYNTGNEVIQTLLSKKKHYEEK